MVVPSKVVSVDTSEVLRRELSPVFPHVHVPDAFCGLAVFSRRTHPHLRGDFTKFKAAVRGGGGGGGSGGCASPELVRPSDRPTVRPSDRPTERLEII